MIASEMTGNSNVTDIDLDWTDPYTLLDGLVWLKAIIGSFIGLKLTIGTYLMTAATLFERYSGDPRKRGLMNQLVTQSFGFIVICNWLTLPVPFWRIIIGPVSISKVYWAWCFMINFYTYGMFLPGSEHLIVKFISVVILKRMPPINDDFFGLFLLLTNMCLSSMFSLVNSYTYWFQRARRRYQGWPMDTADHSPLNFNLTNDMLVLGAILIVGVTYAVKREKRNFHGTNQETPNVVNNSSQNKEFITTKKMLLFAILLTAGPILSAVAPRVGDTGALKITAYLLLHLVHSVITLLFIPLNIFYSNPDFRRFSLDLCRPRIKVAPNF